MRQLDLFGNIIETFEEERKPSVKEDEFRALQTDESLDSEVNLEEDIFNVGEPANQTGEAPNAIEQEQISEPEQVSLVKEDQETSTKETVDAVVDNYSTDGSVMEAGQAFNEPESEQSFAKTEPQQTFDEEDPAQIFDEIDLEQTQAETESQQTFDETELEQASDELETDQTFDETERNNEKNVTAENLPLQIIELSGVKEVVVEEPVETSKNITEEKASDKTDDSEIFNDGKIRVKIKQKQPPVAVIEEEKEEEKTEEEEIKEEQPAFTQKRGRKSFKEIDAEADLIEIPEDEVLFERQYYSISQVAEWFKVNTSLIRFWENEFDILKPKKNRKGDRLFRPEDVKNLQLIYHLLRQRKYTIEGAKEFIKTNKNKADLQLQLTNTLQKVRSFLLDLKANL